MPLSSHNPDERPDLGEVLRPAVEEIRQAAAPREAVDRSVNRALRIGARPTPRRWTGRRTFFLFSGTLAASLLVAALAQVGSFPPVGYFARTGDDPNPGDPLLVRAGTPEPFDGSRVPVLGDPDDRFLRIGLNQFDDEWERGNGRALQPGQTHEDFRVQATWTPHEADVRLHLIDPAGKSLPVAEIEADGRRSRCCVIAQAAEGAYVIEASLGEDEEVPPGGIAVTVQITLQGGGSRAKTHDRHIKLEKPGQRVRVARVGF